MDTTNDISVVALLLPENPPEIHSVMDIIATHLKCKVLTKTRRVCSKIWNVPMSLQLLKRRCLTRILSRYSGIDNDPSTQQFFETFSINPAPYSANSSEMSPITLITITTTTAIVNPLELEAVKVEAFIHLDNPLMTNWTSCYGKNVFLQHGLSSSSTVEPIVDLDILDVNGSHYGVVNDLQFESVVQGIFQFLKSLKVLRLSKKKCQKDDEIGPSSLFDTPNNLERIIKNLTTIDFENCQIDPKLLRVMSTLEFESLTHVSIGRLGSYSVESVKCVFSFFEKFHKQLEFLYLGPSYYNDKIGTDIIYLPIVFGFEKLKTLEVSINKWDLGSFNKFLRKVPNLVTLRLNKPNMDLDDDSFKTEFEDGINSSKDNEEICGNLLQLREFKLPNFVLNTLGMQKIVQLFQHVRIMAIKIHVDSMRSAMSYLASMQNLEKLDLAVFNGTLVKLSFTERITTSFNLIVKKMEKYTVQKVGMIIKYENGLKFTFHTGGFHYIFDGFLSERGREIFGNTNHCTVMEESYRLLRS